MLVSIPRRLSLAAALPLVIVLVATACSAAGGAGPGSTVTGQRSSEPGRTSLAPQSPSSGAPSALSSPPRRKRPSVAAGPTSPVHVSSFQGDGQRFGVGFAIIALFDVAPTSAVAFDQAVTVSVNGEPAGGAWFWQRSEVPGSAMEAIYRPRSFWPAHAKIFARFPVKGLSAGRGLSFDDSLTLSISTGHRNVSTVDNATHMMTVTSDGRVVHRMPVSLGAGDTPTYNGTKLVMQKGEDVPGTRTPRPLGEVRMKSSPGEAYYNLLVPWSVRITNSGEYVHAASWNTGNIGSRNTSHGCTNLDVAAAKWFYGFAQIGDVVQYPNANTQGKTQPSWDGWGWWNLPWSQWQAGGLLAAR